MAFIENVFFIVSMIVLDIPAVGIEVCLATLFDTHSKWNIVDNAGISELTYYVIISIPAYNYEGAFQFNVK